MDSKPAAVSSGQGVKILLVEDNRVNQMVATAMLKLDGHEIDVAENGLEAISAVLRKSYDLILMDMQMPEMDGLDTTREIRQLEGAVSKTPIVAMTANAMVEHRRLCMDAGMDDFLAKPIDHGRLSDAVSRWSGQSSKVGRRPSPVGNTENATIRPSGDTASMQNDSALEALCDDLDDILGNSEVRQVAD